MFFAILVVGELVAMCNSQPLGGQFHKMECWVLSALRVEFLGSMSYLGVIGNYEFIIWELLGTICISRGREGGNGFVES
jgi:hypothetical protein